MEKIIFGPCGDTLRGADHEQKIVRFAVGLAPTPMMSLHAMSALVTGFHGDGGVILTASEAQIDMLRLEQSGELFARSVNGELLMLATEVPLMRMGDSFGADPKRTMNRIWSKLGKPAQRRVNVENLSRYFWMTVAMEIEAKCAARAA